MDHGSTMTNPDDKKKSNLRLAIILASVAVVFFVGFIAKVVLLGR
jgi:flagellar basal body-associated protein FliL